MSIKFDVPFEKACCPFVTLTVIVGALRLMLMIGVLGATKAFVAPESEIADSCLCWGGLQHNDLECASFFLGITILFILTQLMLLHSMSCWSSCQLRSLGTQKLFSS